MISYTSGLFLLYTFLVDYLLGWSNSPFLRMICDSYITLSSFLLWKANFPSRGKKVFLGWNVCLIRLDEWSEGSLYTAMMDREGRSATISLASPALDARALEPMSGCSENYHSWGISSEWNRMSLERVEAANAYSHLLWEALVILK